MRIALLIYFLFVSSISNAQEAEKFFQNEYSKISFVINRSTNDVFNQTNIDGFSNPALIFTKNVTYQFGFFYNFAQSGAFNFKTGIVAKPFSPLFNLNIDKSKIGSGNIAHDFSGFDAFNQYAISVPFKVEYFRPITKKLNFVAGVGVAYNVITGDSGTTTTSISVRENNESLTVFSARATEQDKNILSVEYGIGVNFRTNFAFFQLEYNRSVSLFSTPLSGDYKFINLNNSPDISGFFQSNLDYRSVSLTFAPKKGWLKRKSKK